MRTKTILLSAAAIAAGLLSSVAQSNVYSVNVVGYVNTTFAGLGKYTLVANPLVAPTNDLVALLDAVLPNKSQVLTWNGTGYVGSSKAGGIWSANLPLPVGSGFFVKTPTTSGNLTNTFVGSVLIGFGQTNTVALPAGYTLAGSPVPYAGDLTTDTNINLGDTLPNKSQMLRWDVATQGFVGVSKGGGTWSGSLNVGVGEGFFINAKSATNWSQTLNP